MSNLDHCHNYIMLLGSSLEALLQWSAGVWWPGNTTPSRPIAVAPIVARCSRGAAGECLGRQNIVGANEGDIDGNKLDIVALQSYSRHKPTDPVKP
jgi:hypothetical protein